MSNQQNVVIPLHAYRPQRQKVSYYVGIDPGASGGIGVVTTPGSGPWGPDGLYVKTHAHKLPKDIPGVSELLSELQTQYGAPEFCLIEKVGIRYGQRGQSEFVWKAGALEGVVATLNWNYGCVTPQAWQKYMECKTGGDKRVTRTKAKEIFPGVPVYHWNADALLIAEYARLLCCTPS